VDQPPIRADLLAVCFRREGLARRLRWAAAACYIVAPLSYLLPAYALAGVLLTLLAPLVLVASLVVASVSRARPGALTVGAEGLTLERAGRVRRIPLADITDGWLSPLEDQVVLRRRSGNLIQARLARFSEGRAVLEAAGLDAARRTLRMPLGRPSWWLAVLTLVVGYPVVSLLAVVVLFVLPAQGMFSLHNALAIGGTYLLYRGLRALAGPGEIVIGADGIIARSGGRARFVAYDRLASVGVEPDRIRLLLVDGQVVPLRARKLDAAAMEVLDARIEDARAAWRSNDTGAQALAQLDRRGRDPGAWAAALRGVLEPSGDYRRPVLTRDQLTAVLESPAAPAERRLAAAVALQIGDAPEDRARIRVAAGACANPRLRVALAQAADGDVAAALEEAMLAEEAAAAEALAGSGRAR
jgi:hypothetical protein